MRCREATMKRALFTALYDAAFAAAQWRGEKLRAKAKLSSPTAQNRGIPMPAQAPPPAPQTAAREDAAGDAAVKMAAEARRAFEDASRRIETAVQEGLTQLRSQSRVYADVASEHIDQAGEYIGAQVRERPLA